MAYTDSLNIIMVMNGTAIVGRLLPNWLADHVGALTIFIPAAGAGAILMYSWVAIESPAGLYIWAAAAGNALGAIQALFPSALASLTTDLNKQGSRIGLVFTIVSFAVLTGPPISGALISALHGRYIGAQLFAGASLTLGMVCLAASRERRRKNLKLSFGAKV